MKKIANRSFHGLARIFLGIPHVDVTNNFKLYKREIVEAIRPHLRSSGFSINAETGIYPYLLGFSTKEIPVSWIGRKEDMGSSSFNILKAGPGYASVLYDTIRYKYFGKKFMQHKHLAEDERKHFDSLVEKTGETYYGNLRPVAKIRFQRKAKEILGFLGKKKNPKILEYGCGTGILAQYLLQFRPDLAIEGIDISPKAIGVAKKTLMQYKNAHFQPGDCLHLPFRNNTFDAVVGNSILHHSIIFLLVRR
ncbi:MAG: methyltransferase domain-containing protein [Candidatus Levybacteria bacterium]|nr:methyltransferase domain-containing protein [Candidatus Levybacteria bacterium]